ncbi:MAG TPA: DUF3857 domain-containing protein [Bacteroidales bacterium]|nr:DUF3857 domain-containing protein [Bacteroidales bacterium]
MKGNSRIANGMLIWLSMVISTIGAFPQSSPITLGEVSRDELETTPYPQEKGAEAVVLCDYATAKMVYSDGFKIEFTRHVRIKIFKSSGYDLANIQIPYTRYDKLLILKAFTHNLEDNQPVKVAVVKKQFYLEKASSYRNVTRFSFPNVREGSVIEYMYTIRQDEIRGYYSLRFQRTVPVRHVEYRASIPEFFIYTINLNHNNMVREQHAIEKGYYNTKPTPFDIYHWSGTNLPPFEPEPMMPESDEYMAGVDFSLTRVNFTMGTSYDVSPPYSKLSEELLDHSEIGHQADNSIVFSGKVNDIIRLCETPGEKMRAVYDHVQQHMKWNGYEQLIPEVSLAKAYRTGTGNNAEINLMLVNMLRKAGIAADPVVLSTRDNGRINTVVAMADNLNYLICCATIEGKDYLLDATDKFRPAGMLPFKCLNVEGWVLNKSHGRWVKLLNDEKRATQEYYVLTLTENGDLTGHASVTFSGYDGVNLRRLIHNEGETGFRQEEIAAAGNVVISNLKFGALDSLESALRITFDVTFRHSLQYVNRMVFFKPLISLFGDYVNPWVKDERNFPVDRGCPTAENFICRIHLPDNYQVGESPKTIRISMPGNDARFLFGAESVGNMLIIRGELNINKTRFETEEYPAFREFYTQVNKKTNEMVILKEND